MRQVVFWNYYVGKVRRMGSGRSAFGERSEKNQDDFYLPIPVVAIVRSRSVEICMQMPLGRDRGSATERSGKVRTLGRVRLRVCECVSHDTRQFKRIHASGLDGGGLLPLQKVDIPSPRISKAAPVP